MPLKSTATITPTNCQQWRAWLHENHDKEVSIWLIYHKKAAGITGITYAEAVEEALCFGWIDSKAKPLNETQYMQFFGRRKKGSGWSKVNKERIERLIANGQMTKAGLDVIEAAKQDGSWTLLDEIEKLTIPEDLEAEFAKQPAAQAYFTGLCRSDKRNMLQWLVLAKKPETREKRMKEIVMLAAQNLKPKQFRGKT
jgi:uncharacterized protein YdeI (YjbR/CyaY-like superfamily)